MIPPDACKKMKDLRCSVSPCLSFALAKQTLDENNWNVARSIISLLKTGEFKRDLLDRLKDDPMWRVRTNKWIIRLFHTVCGGPNGETLYYCERNESDPVFGRLREAMLFDSIEDAKKEKDNISFHMPLIIEEI